MQIYSSQNYLYTSTHVHMYTYINKCTKCLSCQSFTFAMNYQIVWLTLCVVKVSQTTPRCNLPDVIQGFRLVQMHPLLFYDFAAKTHLGVVWLTFTTHQVNFGRGYHWQI